MSRNVQFPGPQNSGQSLLEIFPFRIDGNKSVTFELRDFAQALLDRIEEDGPLLVTAPALPPSKLRKLLSGQQQKTAIDWLPTQMGIAPPMTPRAPVRSSMTRDAAIEARETRLERELGLAGEATHFILPSSCGQSAGRVGPLVQEEEQRGCSSTAVVELDLGEASTSLGAGTRKELQYIPKEAAVAAVIGTELDLERQAWAAEQQLPGLGCGNSGAAAAAGPPELDATRPMGQPSEIFHATEGGPTTKTEQGSYDEVSAAAKEKEGQLTEEDAQPPAGNSSASSPSVATGLTHLPPGSETFLDGSQGDDATREIPQPEADESHRTRSIKPKFPLELEWLRLLGVDQARQHLMSIEGLQQDCKDSKTT